MVKIIFQTGSNIFYKILFLFFCTKKDLNKILRPDQIPDRRTQQFQFSRERTTGKEPIANFLLNRMATPWNNLPKEIALARSVNSFKSKLDLYLGNLSKKYPYLLIVCSYR